MKFIKFILLLSGFFGAAMASEYTHNTEDASDEEVQNYPEFEKNWEAMLQQELNVYRVNYPAPEEWQNWYSKSADE